MTELAKYTADSGNEIVLTADIVRDVIATSPNVTDKEVYNFVALCKAHKLDPFIKEAYLIKYGTQPATIVVGKDVYTKRAYRHPKFRGLEAGIFVITDEGKGKERAGSMVLPHEHVVGGWARVYLDGYAVPIYASVGFDEYAGKRKDGSLNAQWASKPGTMIRKVAVVQALREAFPEDFQGLYDAAEMEQTIEATVAEVYPDAEVHEYTEEAF